MTGIGRRADAAFRPISLRGIELANRLVMSPMTRGRSPAGVPGEDVVSYYRRRAEGGVGLIVTEGVIIDHPAAQGASTQGGDLPILHNEAALAGWKRVVDEIHAAGACIVPQLWHMGVIREDGCPPFPKARPCRPSGLWGPIDGDSVIPLERRRQQAVPTAPMSESEIADVIAAFARSAANAAGIGFDGIALHGGHGYMIDSFLWEETNRRDDDWGGDNARRARFAAEVIKAIRKVIPSNLPIIMRFSQWKQQDFGARIANSPGELEAVLAPLVDAGLDALDASTRRFEVPAFAGSDLTLAGWARKLSGLPAIAVGGIGLTNDLYSSLTGETALANNIDGALDRLESGEFDMIALGRPLIADADWPRKLRNGQPFNPFDVSLLKDLA